MKEQLLAILRERCNHRGLALAHESVLVDRLKTSSKGLRAALAELVRADEVRIVSPLPFLVARVIRSWSGSRHPHVAEKQRSSGDSPRAIDVPVSSSIAAAAANSSGDRGPGEGETLLGEVLAILGPDAKHDEFRQILEGRSPALVRQALRRVQATPRIRVSRAALFRSLLDRLS